MSPEVVVILLMGIAVVIFVAQPLVMRTAHALPTDAAGHELDQLSVQKETIYTAIHDLDFDFQTGKVDQQDYATMRHRLETEAIEILQHIDRVDPLAELDNELERQILSLRQFAPQHTIPTPAKTACPACGGRLHGNENYCPACGHPQGPS